jgi:hypothetical protein
VITGRRSSFEKRCSERGYTLDDARACIVSEDGDTITVDESHKDYPRPKPGPTLLRKAINFVSAASKHVAAGAPMATEAEVERRYAICRGCEFFDGSACKKCGCPIVREKKFLSKLSWADQSCPVGKWGAQ